MQKALPFFLPLHWLIPTHPSRFRTGTSLVVQWLRICSAMQGSHGILAPQPRNEPGPLAVKAWSPNHWTTGEFPLVIVATWCKEPTHWKRPWCWERLKQEKRVAEDEMIGWHHWFNAHEFEQIPEDSEGHGSLACCSPWGCKDMTEWLNSNNNNFQISVFKVSNLNH